MSLEKLTRRSAESDRLMAFQRYIFDISTVFIGVRADRVPAEIERRLREIGEFWDFDQIVLCRFTDNHSILTTIHAYQSQSSFPAPTRFETAEAPWLIDIIYRGKPMALSNIAVELPEDAHVDRKTAKRLGLKSVLILPFIVGGQIQGVFFINSTRTHMSWPPELVRALQHLGQILAGALERLKAFNRLHEIMRFDQLLSEISATYINLPAKSLVKHIQRDLGRLGALLNVERCIFYLPGKVKGAFTVDERFIWWHEKDNDQIKKVHAWVQSNPDFFGHMQYFFDKWNKGEVVRFSKLEDLPREADALKEIYRRFGTKSWLSVPVSVGGAIVGALVVATIDSQRAWSDDLIPRIRLFGEVFANAIKRKEHEMSLRKAFKEIKQLKRKIEADYVYLRDELTSEHHFEEIIGQSDKLKAVLRKVEQVAPTDASVLIQGETGTGKELIARAIHHAGKRSERPLIKVNCAALTPNLIESELFGHERGAFTGADKQRIGRFELADGATLFLDEIGELPLELQPKLLRVLQEGELERLGGSRTIRVDVRIIAATNRNLEKEVEGGRFRSDLWYRLNSFPIFIPPLRERMEDIPLFVTHFINHYCAKIGKRFDKIPKRIIQQLSNYSWPGNIRELDNIISQAVIISSEGHLQISVPDSSGGQVADQRTHTEMERAFIAETLEYAGWKIEGPKGAAQRLQLKPSTLRNKMRKLNISRPTA